MNDASLQPPVTTSAGSSSSPLAGLAPSQSPLTASASTPIPGMSVEDQRKMDILRGMDPQKLNELRKASTRLIHRQYIPAD